MREKKDLNFIYYRSKTELLFELIKSFKRNKNAKAIYTNTGDPKVKKLE